MLSAGSKGEQWGARTEGGATLHTFHSVPSIVSLSGYLGSLNVSNLLQSVQGEAGRDGLSLPGPPGPPGPPGQILTLQDVSGDFSCSLRDDKDTKGNPLLILPLLLSLSSCCSMRQTPSSTSQGSLTLRESA